MKKLCSSIFLMIVFVSVTQAADYRCTNGNVDILITLDGQVYEEFNLDRDIFENNHRLMISEDSTHSTYDQFVVVTFDGAGQESFQAFEADRLAPLKKMADFYYEHEGAYLVGGYFSQVKNEWVDFQYEQMKCQF